MKQQQRYTAEFRAEAVKLVWEEGLSLEGTAQRLGIPKGTLGNWVAKAKGSSVRPAPGARTAAELEQEVKQLRKELAEARQERDILKNRPRVYPRPLCIETCRSYTGEASGQWPSAFWRH
jgi:transposase-like protein